MGATKWEEHEQECYRYLQDTFGKEAKFYLHGGSDSTKADIQVQPNKGSSFWIESKSSQAQSGQFVVRSVDGKFEFSQRNRSLPNIVTEFIVNIMNRSFDKYNNAGTAGINLNIDSEIYARWIKDMYSKKGVKFFMTHSPSGKYVILPIDDFSKYYSISASFRVKKSGSSNVAKSTQEILAENIIKTLNVSESQFVYGVRMKINSPIIQDKQKIEFDGREYMFSKTSDGEFVIRRLSNTNNMNVIFSITLKNENGMTVDAFKKILEG